MQKEIKLFGKTRKVPYMSKEEFEKNSNESRYARIRFGGWNIDVQRVYLLGRICRNM